jgi:hypothetical protein
MSQALRLKCHPKSPQQRRLVIRENIFKTDYNGLAKLCGVTKRTIIRDINQWRQDGGFEQSLVDEFVATYPNIKREFPEKAFDRLCYLIGRQMTRKIESQETIDVTTRHIIVKMWKPVDATAGS